MNKSELIVALGEKTGLGKKEAEGVINAFTGIIEKELKSDGKVAISGFGTFEVTKRKEREGINPKTKEAIKIKASKAPKFKPAKSFKELINN